MRELLVVCLVLVGSPAFAQSSDSSNQSMASFAAAASTAEVPRLIKFSGALLDERGHAMLGPVGVTFALYAQQYGGTALWLEIQNVKPDANGGYIVLLGANSAKGVPMELFTSGEARWLGVQADGQIEQPRVLLVSVPYALKAGDAETLGGMPASAFALSGSQATSVSNPAVSQTIVAPMAAATVPSSGTNSVSVAGGSPAVATPCGAITADGTALPNQVAKFSGPCGVHQSLLFDNGSNVGIGNTSPAARLDVSGGGIFRGTLQLPATGAATSITSFNSNPLDAYASAFNSTSTILKSQNQLFRWQVEPVGNNTTSPSGKLNLLFGANGGTPAETGLSINSKGQITFASGQTLPTVTGNETISGNETVSGTVSGSQLISTMANGTAPLKVTSTTVVPNLNASLLGGLSASSFAKIGTNTFFGSQFISGWGGMVGIGDAGCGASFGAIGFGVNGLNSCTNWSLLGDGTNTVIGRPAGGGVFFEKSGSGVADMVVTSTGQVDIGGTTPHAQLEVDASTGNAVAAINSSTIKATMYALNNTTVPTGVIFHAEAPQVHVNGSTAFCEINTNGGLGCTGDVYQNTPANGLVKALLYFDPSQPAGSQIVRCFNSTIPEPAASTPPCGFTNNHGTPGVNQIDFGFPVNNRFAQVTAVYISGDSNFVVASFDNFFSRTSTQLNVDTFYAAGGPGAGTDTPFYLTVF